MNVHPDYFGRGVGGRLLREIIELAQQRDLPLRLVSSALNLDSYSLYSRYGFSPFAIYQDLLIEVPAGGFPPAERKELPSVRTAQLADLAAMLRIEQEVCGISRQRDHRYFLDNNSGIWNTVVAVNVDGEVEGFLVSLDHRTIRMIGPGVTKTTAAAEAMLRMQLERFRDQSVLVLIPASESLLVAMAYGLGARNCELHLGQARGETQPVRGVVFPSFLPESA